MARRLADGSGAQEELLAAKDAETARLKETIGHLERRRDLFDARLMSFRAAEAEYRAQVATLRAAHTDATQTAESAVERGRNAVESYGGDAGAGSPRWCSSEQSTAAQVRGPQLEEQLFGIPRSVHDVEAKPSSAS